MWAMIEKLRTWAWSDIARQGYEARRSAEGFVAGVPATPAARQQPELLERRAARATHRQQAGEDRHGVDRLSPLLVPVVVLQVQPQRELVERERRRHPVGGGTHAGRP